MSTDARINELYPLASLFMYANKQEVTAEKMKAVLLALGVEPQTKLCEYFEIETHKIKDLLFSISSGAAAPVSTDAAKSGAGAAKEEAKKADAPEDDAEIDFDMF